MKVRRAQQGFTLIEIIIAVAMVAIMSAVLVPPLVSNLKEAKATRAKSDVNTVGAAVLMFYRDLGQWPIAESSTPIDRLVGNASLGGGNAGIPGGSDHVVGAHRWATEGHANTLSSHLMTNRTAVIDTLWNYSDDPDESPGWNGPYLQSISLDPWGSPYVINIRYARPSLPGTLSEHYNKHNIMVLSAGPNKIFETMMSDSHYDESIGGDDIGFVFNAARRH